MLLVESGQVNQLLHFMGPPGIAASIGVRRKRGAGSLTAMTTPTVTEVDATNAPGLYTLLMDEDMTITSGKTTEEMAFYISGGGMTPVLKTVCLYDSLKVDMRKVVGQTLVAGGSDPAQPFGV